MFVPGLPISADGATLHSAVGEMIDALRECAEDWPDRLLDAPSHRGELVFGAAHLPEHRQAVAEMVGGTSLMR